MHKTLFLMVLFLVSSLAPANAAERQIVAGAGPSTAVVKLFFEKFAQKPAAAGYEFVVPERSAKHEGGILSAGDNLFGRSGRPLTAEEKARNKGEIFLARMPIAFSTGSGAGVSRLTLEQLQRIYTGEITNWKQVGGADAAIVLVGRESTEAIFSALCKDYPFFAKARFAQEFKKDNLVVNFLGAEDGRYALAFGAKANFEGLNVLTVDGFSSGVSLGLIYDIKNQDHPVVRAASDYSRTSEWSKIVNQTGLLAAE